MASFGRETVEKVKDGDKEKIRYENDVYIVGVVITKMKSFL